VCVCEQETSTVGSAEGEDEGLFSSYSVPIQFLFSSYSVPLQLLFSSYSVHIQFILRTKPQP
jgi:hypothetical protein